MKPLVSAWYAQCWVDAGGKHALRACELRAISNGMVTPTLFSWRPVLVHSRTPCVVFFELCTKQMIKPAMRCIGIDKAVTLCADVACLDVGMADERSDRVGLRPEL